MGESGCRGRWISAVATFLIMATSGGTALFAIYSGELKAKLGFNQSSLNMLSSCKDFGAYLAAAFLPENTPTRFMLVFGCLTNSIGYVLTWKGVNGLVKADLWHMCFYISIAATGQSFVNSLSNNLSELNFPESRSMLLGIISSYRLLSGSLLSLFYFAIYETGSTSLILFMGYMPATLWILFLFTVNQEEVKGKQENEKNILRVFSYHSLILGTFLTCITFVELWLELKEKVIKILAGLICAYMCVPYVLLLLVRKDGIEVEESANKIITVENNVTEQPMRGENFSCMQAILSGDMWFILASSLLGLGACLSCIDNMGQIGESLNFKTNNVKTFVSLVSVWKFGGKSFIKVLTKKLDIPGPKLLAAFFVLSTCGYLLIALHLSDVSIYVALIVVGFTHGGYVCLLPIIIRDIFGSANSKRLFKWVQVAVPIGSFIFKRLIGYFYDWEATKLNRSEDLNDEETPMSKTLVCIGNSCFGLSFLILAFVSVVGAVISWILAIRTREFYDSIVSKNDVEEEEKKGTEMTPAT